MIVKRALLQSAVLLVLPCAALAQYEGDDGWRYQVTPYVWGSATEGHFAHARLPIDVRSRTSFSESLEDLEFGAMGSFEARKGRYGVLIDGQFAKLSTVLQAPVGGPGLPVQLKTRTASALLAFRYGLWADERSHLDAVAGVRGWSARVRLAYAAPVPLPPPVPQQYSAEQQERWVDLQVGLKGRYGFANGAFVGGWALAGAGASDLSTDLMVLAGYELSDRVSVLGGYRWLTTDYATSSGFRFDTSMAGPGIGLEYRF